MIRILLNSSKEDAELPALEHSGILGRACHYLMTVFSILYKGLNPHGIESQAHAVSSKRYYEAW